MLLEKKSASETFLDGGYIKLGKCLLQRMSPLFTGWIELEHSSYGCAETCGNGVSIYREILPSVTIK